MRHTLKINWFWKQIIFYPFQHFQTLFYTLQRINFWVWIQLSFNICKVKNNFIRQNFNFSNEVFGSDNGMNLIYYITILRDIYLYVDCNLKFNLICGLNFALLNQVRHALNFVFYFRIVNLQYWVICHTLQTEKLNLISICVKL